MVDQEFVGSPDPGFGFSAIGRTRESTEKVGKFSDGIFRPAGVPVNSVDLLVVRHGDLVHDVRNCLIGGMALFKLMVEHEGFLIILHVIVTVSTFQQCQHGFRAEWVIVQDFLKIFSCLVVAPCGKLIHPFGGQCLGGELYFVTTSKPGVDCGAAAQ